MNPLTSTEILNNMRKNVLGNKNLFKVTVFGDSGVGKTTLVHQFSDVKFESNSDIKMTIGGEFTTASMPISSNKEIKILFSDVAGQKRFEEMNDIFFEGAEICFAVFDLTRANSLDNLFKNWIPRFVRTVEPNSSVKLQLIGNKSDLEDYIVISLLEIEDIATKISFRFPQLTLLKPHLITSAKYNRFETDKTFYRR